MIASRLGDSVGVGVSQCCIARLAASVAGQESQQLADDECEGDLMKRSDVEGIVYC